ncbi:MAG TPA: serine/threonine protein kinase, partial [Gammaproteobacteria bacterium]|nr:serine/threonine protein kinase [Gammaproteobacteria bacterium]
LGGSFSGEGASKSAADKVVDEIVEMGGKAVASYESVSTMEGAEKTMQVAKDAFGSVHMLINNAGI